MLWSSDSALTHDEPDDEIIWPEIDLNSSSSYGLYITSEKALDDLYDKYAFQVNSVEDYDEFIDDKIIQRVNSLKSIEGRSEEEKRDFSLMALDDEASWLISRYPQFIGGTILGFGGAGYSTINGDFGLGTALSVGGGSVMTYTAFNGTSETIDKILSFKDSITEQRSLWEQVLEEHRENGFSGNGLKTREINDTQLHPFSARHDVALKEDDDWDTYEFAESFDELFQKYSKEEVGKLLYQNTKTIAPKYVEDGLRNILPSFKTVI